MKIRTPKSTGIAMSSKFLTAAALLMLPALALSGQTVVAEKSDRPANTKSEPDSERPQIRVEKRSPAYWRVTFDNPPFNIFGPETIPQMEKVVAEIEADPDRASSSPITISRRPSRNLQAFPRVGLVCIPCPTCWFVSASRLSSQSL
jgi:hypothetical protein